MAQAHSILKAVLVVERLVSLVERQEVVLTVALTVALVCPPRHWLSLPETPLKQ